MDFYAMRQAMLRAKQYHEEHFGEDGLNTPFPWEEPVVCNHGTDIGCACTVSDSHRVAVH